jgi:hypothetical protein
VGSITQRNGLDVDRKVASEFCSQAGAHVATGLQIRRIYQVLAFRAHWFSSTGFGKQEQRGFRCWPGALAQALALKRKGRDVLSAR